MRLVRSMVEVRRFLRSPTFLSVAVHGAAGVGFAAANLVLARVLPAREYAYFTLATALMNLGFALAPCGIDGVVLRRDLDLGPRMLATVLGATSLVALVLGGIGAFGYDMGPALDAMVFVAIAAGGAMWVSACRFQRERRYKLSLSLMQSPNLVLVLAALVVVATRVREAWLPLLVSTLGVVLAGLVGWAVLFAERGRRAHLPAKFPWREAATIMGLNASGLLLVQLDRLVIPHLLPLEELAVYGVLAAIVGSLFRVLQMGVAFSLTPRLAAAADVRERRRLIGKEARLVLGMVVLGSLAIWMVTPVVEQVLLAGKYHLTGPVILAGIAAGVAKSLNAFSTATVTALADQRELTLVNVLGWVSVGVSVLAAVVLARWGLAGVVYGVGLGWLLRAITGMGLTMRHLHLPVAEPVTPKSL